MKPWKLDRRRGYQDAGLDKADIALLLLFEDKGGVSFEEIEEVILKKYGIPIGYYM